ncbi:hypothetical protein ABZO31_14280 [Streptomyces sp. HUAS MG47]|uniref:hypothetical protein n=1 Tax=Streptomyces solicamelliae TaxID=3231716 RepID=UPI00387824A4
MNLRNSLDSVPSWVPATGHALRHAGVYFDAVRVPGVIGQDVMYRLLSFTDFPGGPIIRECTRERSLYFLLPPGGSAGRVWPAPARALGRDGKGSAFVGIPAVDGLTWPLKWQSLPTDEHPFVDGELLHEKLVRALR